MSDKVITGEWDGKPIWRYKTPEEKLVDAGIDPTVAEMAVGLLGNDKI